MRTITSPGKFEGEHVTAPAIYALALCGADDECGDIQEFGFYAWRFDGLDSSDFCATARIDDGLTDSDIAHATAYPVCIVVEDSSGFVRVTFHGGAAGLARWDSLCDRADVDSGEDMPEAGDARSDEYEY